MFQLQERLLIEPCGFEVLLGVCNDLLDDREVDGTLYKKGVVSGGAKDDSQETV